MNSSTNASCSCEITSRATANRSAKDHDIVCSDSQLRSRELVDGIGVGENLIGTRLALIQAVARILDGEDIELKVLAQIRNEIVAITKIFCVPVEVDEQLIAAF